MTDRLSKKERQERILARLQSDVTIRISTLAKQLAVTTETIRRDIDELTGKGLVSRTYGGAAAKHLSAEPGVRQRYQTKVAERERIGRKAASLIAPGEVLMVDSGSTTTHFAQALATLNMGGDMELTTLTNSLSVASRLGGVNGFRVILCPGDYRETENGVYGQETTEFLDRFHANKAIISASGITDKEITDVDLLATAIKRKMIERSEHVTLLADHGKFNQHLLSSICALGTIDALVVDSPPPENLSRALSAASVEVHIAT